MQAADKPVKLAMTEDAELALKERKKEIARTKAAERSATAVRSKKYCCLICDRNLSSGTALKTHLLSARHLAKELAAVKL